MAGVVDIVPLSLERKGADGILYRLTLVKGKYLSVYWVGTGARSVVPPCDVVIVETPPFPSII